MPPPICNMDCNMIATALCEDIDAFLGSFYDNEDFHSFADTPMEALKRETLNAHNNFRGLHGCPPLAMSDELGHAAQQWAEKLADRGVLQYSENPSFGENICVLDLESTPSSRRGEQVVREWYKEIDNYNYKRPGWKKGAYHVSQLLWKSSSEIGVGVAKAPGQNKAYMVVNYRPAGNNNMPGEFERNVLPPQRKVEDNLNLRKPRRS